jgi:hypothetical protein
MISPLPEFWDSSRSLSDLGNRNENLAKLVLLQ